MDKSKSKKKLSTKGTKTTKKTEKSKKKKTTKSKKAKEEHIGDENNENNNENVEVIEQKEDNQNEEIEDVEYLKEKLNQPLNKKKLPPIDKNNELDGENENIENKEEEDIKKEKINNDEINLPIEKEEIGLGTPYFYDIGGLKNDVEQKNKKINEENISQEKYKISLNNLLNDLNKILSENVELLYDEEKDEIKRQKQEKIQYLQNILFSYQQQKKDIIEKNKSYKQHYELLLKQDETRMAQNAKEYEALIEEKKMIIII